MKIIHRFDPFLGMPTITPEVAGADNLNDYFWKNDHFRFVDSTYQYWADMVSTDPEADYDLPYGTKVTLNVDNPADPSVYYLIFEYPEGHATDKPIQTDLFFVLRDDVHGPDSDVSEIGGAQCRDCGAVNVVSKYNTKHHLTKPVWRQAADGAHMLCDNCGDMDFMRMWCTKRGYEWDDQGPIEAHANDEWDNRDGSL